MHRCVERGQRGSAADVEPNTVQCRGLVSRVVNFCLAARQALNNPPSTRERYIASNGITARSEAGPAAVPAALVIPATVLPVDLCSPGERD